MGYRNSVRCGYCHRYGHNRRTCDKLHAGYGDPTLLYSSKVTPGQGTISGQETVLGQEYGEGNVDEAYRKVEEAGSVRGEGEEGVSGQREADAQCEPACAGIEDTRIVLTREEVSTWWDLVDPHHLQQTVQPDSDGTYRRAYEENPVRQGKLIETTRVLGRFLEGVPQGALEGTPVETWNIFLRGFTYDLPSYWAKQPDAGKRPRALLFNTIDVREDLAKSSTVPPEILSALAQSGAGEVRSLVAQNPRTPADTLSQLGEEFPELLPVLVRNPNVSLLFLARLAKMRSVEIREGVAQHPKATVEILGYIASRTRNKRVVAALWTNKRTPKNMLYYNR